MRFFYRAGADIIWVLHFLIVVIALFGWLAPWLWPAYIAVLVGTLVSTLVYGYCVLSKWEYQLRKKINEQVEYDFSYASYYTYKLTHGRISPNLLKWGGMLFVCMSLAISLYFRYFF